MDILNLEQEFHIKDYINVMRRRRSIILLFFVTIVFIVTVGSFAMKPVYRATVTLLIDTESPNVLTTSGAVALESQNYYSYKEYYQSQKEIIVSRSILKKVFSELELGKLREYQGAKEPIKTFSRNISVEPVRDTRLLRLHVEDTNPELASKIANHIAQVYVKRNLYYISRDELLNLLKNEFLKLETKLSEYSKIYKEKHPQMMRLREEMQDMVEQIEAAGSLNFEDDFINNNNVSVTNYKFNLEGLKANNVNIEDPADVPVTPVRPKKKLNILLAMFVGIFGGMALAFFFEYIDDTVKNMEDLDRAIKCPFLGTIPDINSKGGMNDIEKDLIAHSKPKEPVSESYRSVRTSILFSATEENPLKCLCLTSPGPQEGKTTTLCNLAIVIAQSGKKVLLVDADMRKPRLHEVFKKKCEKGLSSYLSGQDELDEVVQETGIENLYLIPAGIQPPNPSELIASHKLKEFIGLVKSKFDMILLDAPPAAVVTDAVILARVVDGMIIVIQSGKTSKRALPHLFKMLENARAKIVGAILNKVSINSGDYNYQYYARYYGKPQGL